MAREHGPGEIIELLRAAQTAVSLFGALTLISPLFGDLVRVAVWIAHPCGQRCARITSKHSSSSIR